MIEAYNSGTTIPQMIFLGLDDRQSGGSGQVNGEGLTWKEVYKGRPVWAVDTTPKGTFKKEAENLNEGFEKNGWKFLEGRMILSFPADEGTHANV